MKVVTRAALLIMAGCLLQGCVAASPSKPLTLPEAAVPTAAAESYSRTVQHEGLRNGIDEMLPVQIDGTVDQILTAGPYIYLALQTDAGTGTTWVAAPATPVARGDRVVCSPELMMAKYESPSLKRKFERVYFTGALNNLSVISGMPSNHPPIGPAQSDVGSKRSATPIEIKSQVARAAGGMTIAEISSRSEELAGTEVLLRAMVTKYNADILGANWLRVKDTPGSRFLTVTTKSEVNPGDTVLIRGRLERNVDLGSGYRYDIIIRNAEITVEQPTRP